MRQERTRSILFAFDADEYRKRDLRQVSPNIEHNGRSPHRIRRDRHRRLLSGFGQQFSVREGED
jgi:hypothetical protein